jgi:hypothetical protein
MFAFFFSNWRAKRKSVNQRCNTGSYGLNAAAVRFGEANFYAAVVEISPIAMGCYDSENSLIIGSSADKRG